MLKGWSNLHTAILRKGGDGRVGMRPSPEHHMVNDTLELHISTMIVIMICSNDMIFLRVFLVHGQFEEYFVC